MSRLDYAPKPKEIEITDIKKGLGVFTPKPESAVSFEALKETLKKAGYTLASAEVVIQGTLRRDDSGWWLTADSSGQHFVLEGTDLSSLLSGIESGTHLEINGNWKTLGTGTSAREVVVSPVVKKIDSPSKSVMPKAAYIGEIPVSALIVARLQDSPSVEVPPSLNTLRMPITARALAPIRTTSPGLTVYEGGAVTPRLYFIKQHLGELNVSRQVLDVSVSYTPTERVQLEIEVPFGRTAFDDGVNDGSGGGLGNITLWSKYRFFRTVKTYGDRQAAFRFGLELQTGRKSAPDQSAVNAPTFVRQQLTPINGGLSPHVDVAFSQAGGRFIFGGNVEGILRSERDGFRLGHEVRVNTDLEYVLLPFDYSKPGRELFLILESTFINRGRGRVGRSTVNGSKSTEFYVAPGLQFTVAPQFVIEGSVQMPIVRNTGPLLLRTDLNVLFGARYLF